MCKVALCFFFCFFESTAGLLKTTVRSYVILLTIQLLKVFAHINEQILQIAVAGSCMCVCVCPNLDKKEYKTIQISEMSLK